jgi:hypothetical protein
MITVFSILVLIMNLCIIVSAIRKRNSLQRSFVDILPPNGESAYDEVRQYNRWMYFCINALSTVLLGASNYRAQLLVAPTRNEVDEAHSKHAWVDRGIQSTRDLLKVKPKRRNVFFY